MLWHRWSRTRTLCHELKRYGKGWNAKLRDASLFILQASPHLSGAGVAVTHWLAQFSCIFHLKTSNYRPFPSEFQSSENPSAVSLEGPHRLWLNLCSSPFPRTKTEEWGEKRLFGNSCQGSAWSKPHPCQHDDRRNFFHPILKMVICLLITFLQLTNANWWRTRNRKQLGQRGREGGPLTGLIFLRTCFLKPFLVSGQ